MIRRFIALLVTLGALVPGLSRAAHFDFIYADQITIHAPLSSWGLMLAGSDFGLLVNEGVAGITMDDLLAADFDVVGLPEWPDTTSPRPNPCLRPGINVFQSGIPPIQPHEAMGSVGSLNAVLGSLVAPGETFRNT